MILFDFVQTSASECLSTFNFLKKFAGLMLLSYCLQPRDVSLHKLSYDQVHDASSFAVVYKDRTTVSTGSG